MSVLGALEKYNNNPWQAVEKYNPLQGYADLGAAAAHITNPVGNVNDPLSQRYEAVRLAAEKYRINPVLLWGVYGVETSHGADVKTSETGAKGSFQFEPQTAAAFGYPYTNATDLKTFTKQAEGAAHYLATLLPGGKGEAGLKAGHDWETAWEKALRSYSAGGYGLAQVKAHTFRARKGETAIGSVTGGQEENVAEKEKVEGELPKPPEWLASLEQFLGGFALKGLLIAAGIALMIYGVMVAVRPREQAFSIPLPLR